MGSRERRSKPISCGAMFNSLKKQFLHQEGFRLIVREHMEMIEYKKDSEDILIYYSHPPLVDVIKNL